jgi:hypothetical protein
VSFNGWPQIFSVIQGRKVAGHSRGFSDLNWHPGVLASSKYQDLSLKFEGWFGMHPLTSARAKIVSEEGQSMGAFLRDCEGLENGNSELWYYLITSTHSES